MTGDGFREVRNSENTVTAWYHYSHVVCGIRNGLGTRERTAFSSYARVELERDPN